MYWLESTSAKRVASYAIGMCGTGKVMWGKLGFLGDSCVRNRRFRTVMFNAQILESQSLGEQEQRQSRRPCMAFFVYGFRQLDHSTCVELLRVSSKYDAIQYYCVISPIFQQDIPSKDPIPPSSCMYIHVIFQGPCASHCSILLFSCFHSLSP